MEESFYDLLRMDDFQLLRVIGIFLQLFLQRGFPPRQEHFHPPIGIYGLYSALHSLIGRIVAPHSVYRYIYHFRHWIPSPYECSSSMNALLQ